jgi:hypothetical protein
MKSPEKTAHDIVAGARGAGRAGLKPGEWGPPRRGARLIGQFVEELTKPAFARYGFSAAVILTQWAAIAGPELAAYTVPERLKWPRGAGLDDEYEDDDRRRGGAMLILRVSGPRAVEIQHRSHELIERVNAAFGFGAVAQIRIIQAPVDKRNKDQWRLMLRSSGVSGAAKAAPGRRPVAVGARVEDERLQAALERMANGLSRRLGAA